MGGRFFNEFVEPRCFGETNGISTYFSTWWLLLLGGFVGSYGFIVHAWLAVQYLRQTNSYINFVMLYLNLVDLFFFEFLLSYIEEHIFELTYSQRVIWYQLSHKNPKPTWKFAKKPVGGRSLRSMAMAPKSARGGPICLHRMEPIFRRWCSAWKNNTKRSKHLILATEKDGDILGVPSLRILTSWQSFSATKWFVFQVEIAVWC